MRIWDETATLKRVKGKPERLLKLLSMFLSNMPAQVERLKEAIENEAYQDVGIEAHGINGVVSQIGGVRVQEIALQVECAGKENNAEKVKILLPEFLEHFNDFYLLMEEEHITLSARHLSGKDSRV